MLTKSFLIERILEHNFKSSSIKEFADKYNISPRTVKNYIIELEKENSNHKIQYSKRKMIYSECIRDKNGRFDYKHNKNNQSIIIKESVINKNNEINIFDSFYNKYPNSFK